MSHIGVVNRLEAFVLFVGDAIVFYASLRISLLIRYAALPERVIWRLHVKPFSIIFLVWIFVFFIAGLYEKHTTILKNRLPTVIFNAQIANSILAILFFYLIRYFEITPKTILFIYLVVSFALVVFWRRHWFPSLLGRKRQNAVLIGSGEEMHELLKEVNENSRYGIYFVSSVDLDAVENIDFEREIIERVYSENITTVVIDTKNEKVSPILPRLYNLIFSRVRFIDMYKVYEDIFDRVPLSLVRYSWFLENVSATRKFTYEFLKRLMDILISFPLALISLIVYPLVALLIKIEDGGSIFYVSERVGKDNAPVRVLKFRTMTGSDSGEAVLATKLEATRVGKLLRKLRVDEIPQLWDVVQGDLSLIGPRPEYAALVREYVKEIPYYNVRHLIKPGLSGWGVLHDDDVPRGGTDVERTRRKLSYDLYYIKNRSFLLDLEIVLKTIRRILSRSGT